jgi:CRP/FNR family transcriptional regulator, cyclic AMP receptor protein
LSISPLLLRRWESFEHFSDEQLEELGRHLTREHVAAGATLLRVGEPTADAYLIESGSMRIERRTPYGLFNLATLEPGDLFGETSFIDRHARSGDAVAITATDLLRFSPVELAEVMEADQRLALALHWTFWKSLSRKLRLTNEKLARFFSTAARPPAQPPSRRDASGEFRIDLASKRKLFQEQKLSTMEINFLSSLSREKRFRPGEVIFREGESGEVMYVVLDGRVMISKYISGAGEEALAFLERGDYFGEMALIDNQPRSADATAHEGGAVVLAIPREVLNGILDIHKLSSLRLLKILCNLVATRLRELDDKIIGWFILAGGGAAGPGGHVAGPGGAAGIPGAPMPEL